ncbi:hypothetical protein G9A89_010891 [Geosiphon pyriformis]|nr:hypothetical protein G9A89_010891 [Geosiphon pyriformis]
MPVAMSFFQRLSVRISPKYNFGSGPYSTNNISPSPSDTIVGSQSPSPNTVKSLSLKVLKCKSNTTAGNIIEKSDGITQKGIDKNHILSSTSTLNQPHHHHHHPETEDINMPENNNTLEEQQSVPNSNNTTPDNGVQALAQKLRNTRHPLETDPELSFNRELSLANFELCRTLGTGSFGRVHLAQSNHNRDFYAMKVLKKSEVVRLKQVEHTNNEKRILEQINHPFLVGLWGTFQDSANLYMVMDYVVGGELFSVLRKTQRFPDHVAKFYAAEVLLAFEYLHEKDIIYRDLKPENLLLDRNGHIKITDFGFAKHVPDITWTLCGTPDYLAPEVIQSKGYSKAVDWYSLGVLIFEMLAGYPPFYDEDHMRLYEKILGGRVKYPNFFEPVVKDLLKRLLTADLSKRFGNLKGGSEDIKNHNWFKGVDWDRLLRQDIEAPYIPHVNGDGDTSNFDMYPEEREPYGKPCHDIYREKFPLF